MSKKIENYLHLYLGCGVMGDYDGSPRRGYLTGISGVAEEQAQIQFFEEDGFNVCEEPEYNQFVEVKLILRPLSDIKEDEAREYAMLYMKIMDKDAPVSISIKDGNVRILIGAEEYNCAILWPLNNYGQKPESLRYLLSKHFDLFGLIESGLAIDSTKLNPHA